MGRLLRRYWYPVAVTGDLEEPPVRRVRLLGEDLVLFRDGSGRLGLVDEACPHRRASLAYGVCEPDGLRCAYHGWLFGRDGRCLEQPAEPPESTFKDRITVTAYPVQELGGMVWAYLGPAPAPMVPRYDVFVWDGVFRDIGHALLPVSWMQIMENAVDPHHVEWLHGRYFRSIQERRGLPVARTFGRRHVKIAFDQFEHGIIKRRLLEGQSEDDDDWRVGHPLVFPYMMRVGGGGSDQMQIRVPVDDQTTWFVLYTVHHPGGLPVAPQERIPAYEVPRRDDRGNHIVDYIEGQDIMTWVTQGPIAERNKEHLGASDAGVIMLRRLFGEQLARVEAGEDPLGVLRAEHDVVELPCEKDKFGAGAAFQTEWLRMGSHRHSPALRQNEELYARAGASAGAGR